MILKTFAIGFLCAAMQIVLQVRADPVAAQEPNLSIVLSEDGTWSYVDESEGGNVAADDGVGGSVQLFESFDAATGTVTRSWIRIEAVSGLIDVAVSRIVESTTNDVGSGEYCIPVYTIRNLSGMRLDRLLVGVDYLESGTEIGRFSFMIGPLDDGEEQDVGAPGLHVSDCNDVTANLNVVECRVTSFISCRDAVSPSAQSAIPLAIAPAKP